MLQDDLINDFDFDENDFELIMQDIENYVE